MGRPYSTARVSIALADLDRQLRASAAGSGVTDVVAELRGELVSRPAARSARRAAQEGSWAAADDAIRSAGLDRLPWAGVCWRRSGAAVSCPG